MARIKYVRSPKPRLLTEYSEEEDDEASQSEPKDKLARLAGVFDLEAESITVEAGGRRWFEALGHLPLASGHSQRYQVTPAWQARVAAHCDLAIFLSGNAGLAQDAIERCREAARRAARPTPMVFLGPYTPDAASGLSALPEGAQGLLIQEPDPAEDPIIAAEQLRRACSCLPSELLLGGGKWTAAPVICISARLEVLVAVPPQAVEYTLILGAEPLPQRRPGGTLLVSQDLEDRPWWADEYLTFGPGSVSWRPWARDPRAIA